MPVDQGIFATCYATLEEPLTRDEVRALYEERYADEPFIDLMAGSPRTQNVRDTNRAQVHVTVVGERVLASARSTTSGRAPRARPCRT